ncbi:MAG TPA: hypothetical protein VM282_01925 [Acidimicrobiales bacterium]|nr:hypothetical protein [Acidimicrobiales bacterium]
MLRIRERGDDNKRFWHIAVDDGTADRVRAWRVKSAPPLPDATAVSAALGWPVTAAPEASPHPLAVHGASRTFITPDGGRLITAWIRPSELEAHRHMPTSLATPASGIGEESYRSPMGGGLVSRAGGNVLMVVATLPSLDDAQRDRVIATVARLTFAGATAR